MSLNPRTIDLADALPHRPVAVRPPQTVAPLALLGLFAMLFGCAGGLLWWLGPDLVRDWRIGSDAAPAGDARIEQARCRSRLFLLHLCDLTLVDNRGGSGARRTLWYAFVDAEATGGLAAALPVRSASEPGLLATSFGIEKLLMRSLTLALAVSLILLCLGVAVRATHQGLRNAGAFRNLSGQKLTPVVVEIERHNLVPPRRRLWVYLYDDAGRRERASIELPSRDRLLFTDASERWALALRGGHGPPLLLDAQLSTLDLTAAEKDAFYAACRRAFGGEDGNSA